MYLQACADKLQKEMKDFGYPPKFPDDKHVETSQPAKVYNSYVCTGYQTQLHI